MFALTTRSPRAAVRRLAFSRLISLTGTHAAMIALAFTVYQRTGSAVWVSAALLATFAAAGIATPFGGALGDHFDRRRVLIVSDLAGAGTFAVLAFVHDPAWMIALVFLAETVASPSFPAVEAAVPNLAGPDNLAWANGTIGFGRNIGEVLGPVLGGVVAAAGGASLVFWLNALSFGLSAALVWSVRGRFSEEREPGAAEHHGVRAGFVFAWRDRVLRTVALAWMVLLFGVGLTIVGELPLSRAFGVGVVGYSLIAGFWGVGAVVGSLLGKGISRKHERSWLFLGTVGPAVGFGAIAFVPWFPAALACMAIAGGTDAVSTVAFQNMSQRRTPDAVRSRVMAAIDTAVTGTLALSFVAAGPFINAMGARASYAAAGISCLLGAAVLLPIMVRGRQRESATDEIETGVAAA